MVASLIVNRDSAAREPQIVDGGGGVENKSLGTQGVAHLVEGGRPVDCHAHVRSRRDDLTSAERKRLPIVRGVLDYFPDALLAVAHCSQVGNDQHNPGEPLHWAKEKSTDEADALVRHLLDRGKLDTDGVRHSAKVAWRALALLQREIEGEQQSGPPNPSETGTYSSDARVFYINRGGVRWERQPYSTVWTKYPKEGR